MAISYNGLWKLLIDKNKKKTDLIADIGISSSTLAKMSKGDEVSLSVLTKICEKYGCDYGDLISFVDRGEGGLGTCPLILVMRTTDKKRQYSPTKGPVLITAGPGTGKTFTLVQRAIYLIQNVGYSLKRFLLRLLRRRQQRN